MSDKYTMDLSLLPVTSNADLSYLNRPKRMNLEQFEQLAVTEQEFHTRQMIYALEEQMNKLPESVDADNQHLLGMVPIHRFTDGIYTRELFIPAGTLVVGKRHAIEHTVMLISGKCLCATERGIEHMEAPMTFISPAGEKRVVFTYPDSGCTWVTIHRTDKTDLKEVEEDVIIAEPVREAVYKALRNQHSEAIMLETNKEVTL